MGLGDRAGVLGGAAVGGLTLGAVLKHQGPGEGWPPRPLPSDLGHLLAQVDEEAALEQAVKFCQVHLGAAAQRQVSVTLPVPASSYRARPGLQAGQVGPGEMGS